MNVFRGMLEYWKEDYKHKMMQYPLTIAYRGEPEIIQMEEFVGGWVAMIATVPMFDSNHVLYTEPSQPASL